MKRMLLILMTLASVAVAQSCFGGQMYYHIDGCYVATDKCKLYDVINVRAGWTVLLPSHVYQGWLFKLRDGSLVNVIEEGNLVCTVLGTNGKIFYIGTDCLTDSASGNPRFISRSEADWVKANAARIEAEKKAKAAAGPTKEELQRAARDAEIRASNERALKRLNRAKESSVHGS